MTHAVLPAGGDSPLMAKLRAAVRPEFQVELYRPDPADPVLGGECAVLVCDGLPSDSRWLCVAHYGRWAREGRPDFDEFVAAAPPRRASASAPRPADCYVLTGLSSQLQLEFAYALQWRHDQRRLTLKRWTFAQAILVVQGSGVASLLDRSVEQWSALVGQHHWNNDRACKAFLRVAHTTLTDLAADADPQAVYASDVWRADQVDPSVVGPSQSCLQFADIGPDWLKDVTKRWARFRLASDRVFGTVQSDVLAVRCFATFLAANRLVLAGPGELTRRVLEDYLLWLAGTGTAPSARLNYLVALRTLLDHCRRYEWLPGLPATATFYHDDFPTQYAALPRFVTEFVMEQLEAPANLARLTDPTVRHVVIVLIETGLRIGDACGLPFNPITVDSTGWPCLRYHNSKVAAEKLIPLSGKATEAIRAQQEQVRLRFLSGSPLLFPRSRGNPDGVRPLTSSAVREQLRTWQATIDLRDEAGQPIRVSPHQWRHTLGTRMINAGVPQHVVQRLLGHASPAMTAVYAQLHDTTLRAAFDDYQRYRVDIAGQQLDFDPVAPTAEAEWLKHNLARVQASLPNGYCGRPPQQDCPHPNPCLTCPDFQTTPQFLPIHRRQRDDTLELIDAAEIAGNTRLADNHRHVHTNLDRIIGALEAIEDQEAPDAAD